MHNRVLREATSLERARRAQLSGGHPHVALSHTASLPYVRQARSIPQVAISADLLVEPSDDQVVQLLDALSPPERAFYSCEANVWDQGAVSDQLLSEIERQYVFVGGAHSEYVRYLHRSDLPSQMWRIRPAREARAYAGFSGVLKKDGIHQRKLLMSCVTNAMWSDARRRRRLGLHGGGIFAHVYVPDSTAAVAAFDAENAFTRVLLAEWMFPWFCGPPLVAAEVWTLIEPSLRDTLDPADAVCAQYMRLPMGCSHSVNILMDIGLNAAGMSLDSSRRLSERFLATSLRRVHSSPFEVYEQLHYAQRNGSTHLLVLVAYCGVGLRDVANAVATMTATLGPRVQPRVFDVTSGPWDLACAAGSAALTGLVDHGEVHLFIYLGFEDVTITALRQRSFWLNDGRGVMAEAWDRRWAEAMWCCRRQEELGGGFVLCVPLGLEAIFQTTEWTHLQLASRTLRYASCGAIWYARSNLRDLPYESNIVTDSVGLGTAVARLWNFELARQLREGPALAEAGSPNTRPRVTRWSRHCRVLLAEPTQEDSALDLVPQSADSCEYVAFLNEDVERRENVILHGRQRCFYLHVDDGVTMASGGDMASRASALMESIANSWEKLGFVVKDRRGAAAFFLVVGYVVAADPAVVRLPDRRVVELYEELNDFLNHEWVSSDRLAHTLGLWVWGAMLRRPLLSIPFYISHQLDRSRGQLIR